MARLKLARAAVDPASGEETDFMERLSQTVADLAAPAAAKRLPGERPGAEEAPQSRRRAQNGGESAEAIATPAACECFAAARPGGKAG